MLWMDEFILVSEKRISKETGVTAACIQANVKCVIVSTEQEEFMLAHIVKC